MNVAIGVDRQVLADLVPTIGGKRLARDIALVLGSAGFVGAAAQLSVHIPGTPVPVTGQTFAVLLVGAALGPIRALFGMITYLAVGAAGMPWFAGGESGLTGPTVGYLAGFMLAAVVVGALASWGGDRTILRTVVTMLIGTILIYAVGVTYLMAELDLGFGSALDDGVRPFLVGDGLKVALAAGLLPGSWKLLSMRASSNH